MLNQTFPSYQEGQILPLISKRHEKIKVVKFWITKVFTEFKSRNSVNV